LISLTSDDRRARPHIGPILAREAAGLRLAGFGGRKPFRHCGLEAFAGFENVPGIGEWRPLPRRADGLLDDRDDRFLKELEQAHARMVAEQ